MIDPFKKIGWTLLKYFVSGNKDRQKARSMEHGARNQ
jgi:hypothetical protein